MKPILILTLLLLQTINSSAQQIIRNFSFELVDCFNSPIGWKSQMSKPDSYSFRILRDESQDGSVCLSIKSKKMPSADVQPVGLFNTMIIDKLLSLKDSIKISAYIRAKDVVDGSAGIWMQLNGLNRIVRDINSGKTVISGTSTWRKIEISLPLSSDVNSVSFGCKFSGSGEALFDTFSVTVGGQKIN